MQFCVDDALLIIFDCQWSQKYNIMKILALHDCVERKKDQTFVCKASAYKSWCNLSIGRVQLKICIT
jgi:hypothetical protein